MRKMRVTTKHLSETGDGVQTRCEVRASRHGLATYVENPDTRWDLYGELSIDDEAFGEGDWVVVIEHKQRRAAAPKTGLETIGVTTRSLAPEGEAVEGRTITLNGNIVAGVGVGVNVCGVETPAA